MEKKLPSVLLIFCFTVFGSVTLTRSFRSTMPLPIIRYFIHTKEARGRFFLNIAMNSVRFQSVLSAGDHNINDSGNDKRPSVAIVGSGAVGGYYGARLWESGADVKFQMRGENYQTSILNTVINYRTTI